MTSIDIITQVDVASGAPDYAGAPQPADRATGPQTDSDYRKRLDKSLHESRRQPEPVDEPPERTRAGSETSRRTEASNTTTPQSESAERSVSSERDQRDTLAVQDPSADDQAQPVEDKTGGEQHPTESDAALQTYVVPDDSQPVPPAGIRQLFDGFNNSIEVSTNATASTEADGDSPIPPAGLFAESAKAVAKTTSNVFVVGADSNEAQVEGQVVLIDGQGGDASNAGAQDAAGNESAGTANVSATVVSRIETATGVSESTVSSQDAASMPNIPSPSVSVNANAGPASGGPHALQSLAAHRQKESQESGQPPVAERPPHEVIAIRSDILLASGGSKSAESAQAVPIAAAAIEGDTKQHDANVPRDVLQPVAQEATKANTPTAQAASSQPGSSTASQSQIDRIAFVDRISNAIQSSYDTGRQIRARLHPPELGTLQIELSVRDGLVTARLEVQNTTAQRAVLDNLSSLRESLAQNGTSLDRITVQINSASGDDAQSKWHNERQQHESNQREHEQEQHQRREDDSPRDEERETPTLHGSAMDQLDIQI